MDNPCKPSIFEQTYESTEHQPAPDVEAPSHSLPNWGECNLRVGNSKWLKDNDREPEHDSLTANPLHEFIYEYDDSDEYKSAWFMHRLEKLIDFIRSEQQPAPDVSAKRPARITEQDAQQIANSVANSRCGSFWEWYKSKGRTLLNELNADRQVPAVSVSDVSALVEALEQYADDHNWCYDTCDIGRDVAKKALTAYRKGGCK